MSSETKWTPGPWAIEEDDGYFDIMAPCRSRLVVGSEGIDCIHNANLIASAPNLYEALADLAEWHEWSLEYSERMADEFYRETSMMAPFKDRAAAAHEPPDRTALAAEKWRAWCAKKNSEICGAAWAALASARGEG